MKYIVALDLETTGLDSSVDGIIEVALVKIDPETFEVQDVFQSFVNPEKPIPEIISQITSITMEMVENAPTFSQIQEQVSDFIGGAPILGHNTNFDRDFLLAFGIPLENNLVLDTFALANFLLRNLKSLSLEYICRHIGYDLL